MVSVSPDVDREGASDTPSHSSNSVTNSCASPKLHLPHRDYFLFRGPITAASHSFDDAPGEHQSANLWWPDDRSWFVGTEIDLNSTHVGASAKCVEEVLASPGLEVLAAEPAGGVTITSDRVNPVPAS